MKVKRIVPFILLCGLLSWGCKKDLQFYIQKKGGRWNVTSERVFIKLNTVDTLLDSTFTPPDIDKWYEFYKDGTGLHYDGDVERPFGWVVHDERNDLWLYFDGDPNFVDVMTYSETSQTWFRFKEWTDPDTQDNTRTETTTTLNK